MERENELQESLKQLNKTTKSYANKVENKINDLEAFHFILFNNADITCAICKKPASIKPRRHLKSMHELPDSEIERYYIKSCKLSDVPVWRTRKDKKTKNGENTYKGKFKKCSVCGQVVKRMGEHVRLIHRMKSKSPLKRVDLRYRKNRLRTDLNHAKDEHVWATGACDFHADQSFTCGN